MWSSFVSDRLQPPQSICSRRLASRKGSEGYGVCFEEEGRSRAPVGGRLGGKAFADGLEDRLVLNVVGIVGLELSSNAGQSALKGVLGRGVDHLGLRCLLGIFTTE